MSAEGREVPVNGVVAGNTRVGSGACGPSPLVLAPRHGSRRAEAGGLRTAARHGLLASVRQNKVEVSSKLYTFDLRPVRSSYGS